MQPEKPKHRPAVYAVFSGIFLFLSYPPFYLGFLAWIALLPLLFVLSRATSRAQAFQLGFITGLVFFIISIEWFRYVTGIGWMLAAGIEALFIALFSVLVFEVLAPRPVGHKRFTLREIIKISLAWTAVELFRAKFPILGFAWNLLGDSQAHSLKIVQSANVFGVYGLSFAIVMVNCLLLALFQAPEKTEKKKRLRQIVLSSPRTYLAVMFALILSHGIYHVRTAGTKTGDLRISLIQGNIPQSVKWELVAREKILEIYSTLTELSGYDDPALILWPEAAFPGYFDRDLAAEDIKAIVRKLGVPALIGTTLLETEDIATNSAVLLGPDGNEKGRYDKLHLVPFGEYLPMKWAFPWFTPYAESLGISDFTPGREKTVFRILNDDVAFSVLICFEDTFPELAREFVEKGAQFLTVITNDAWFGKSAAAAQHLQASILRAVENGVPVVRSANTGISAFISNRGEVLGQVEDAHKEPLFVTGRKTMPLPLEKKTTIFRLGGWIFPYAATALFIIIFLNSKLFSAKRSAVKEKI